MRVRTIVTGILALVSSAALVLAQGATGDPTETAREILERVRLAVAAGEHEEGRACLREAVALLGDCPEEDGDGFFALIVALDRVGVAELGDSESQVALREWILARQERVLPEDDLRRADAMQNLAATKQLLGRVDEAEALTARQLELLLRKLSPDDVRVLDCRAGLALFRWERDPEGAHETLCAIHAVYVERLHPDDERRLSLELNLAVVKKRLNDLPGALELEEAVLASRERRLPSNDIALLHAKLKVGDTKRELGRLDEAHHLLEEVRAAWEGQFSLDYVHRLALEQCLALIRHDLGDHRGAHEIAERLLEALERSREPDDPNLLWTRRLLAVTKRMLGDLWGALELEEDVCRVLRSAVPAEDPLLLDTQRSLAITRRALGDLAGARELAERVYTARKGLPPDHPDRVGIELDLAELWLAAGDLEGARAMQEELYERRASLLAAGHSDVVVAIANNLAVSRLLTSDAEGARALLGVVVAELEEGLPPGHPHVLLARLNLAAAAEQNGDVEDALEVYEAVHAAWEPLLPPDHPDLLLARWRLARARWMCGEVESMCALLPPFIDGLQQRIEGVRVLSAREALAVAGGERALFDVVLSLGRFAPSLDARLVELMETRRYLSTLWVAGLPVLDTPEGWAVRRAIGQVRLDLAEAIAEVPSGGADADAWRSRVSDLRATRDERERAYFELAAAKGFFVEPFTPERLASVLAGGEVAVGYLRYDREPFDEETGRAGDPEPHFLAMVVSPDGAVHRVELGPAARIEELAERWRAALGHPIDPDGDARVPEYPEREHVELEAGKDLRRKVLDPLPTAERYHVCLDGVLHLVPLDALPLDDGTRVGEHRDIRTQVSFGRLLAPRPARPSEPGLFAVGGVDFDAQLELEDGAVDGAVAEASLRGAVSGTTRSGHDSWPPLPRTKDEVAAIADLFRWSTGQEPVVLSGAEATKARLRALAPGMRHVHLATHGWFLPERVPSIGHRWPRDTTAQEWVTGFAPLALCGLSLAGANDAENPGKGILTGEELAGLDLSGCDLAVLSACETSVGEDRAGLGIQSLQSALHGAGARTAITSLWVVGDHTAEKLMVEFYRNLWGKEGVPGMGKADALWKAKMTLRDFHYPVGEWAGWILTGDPD